MRLAFWTLLEHHLLFTKKVNLIMNPAVTVYFQDGSSCRTDSPSFQRELEKRFIRLGDDCRLGNCCRLGNGCSLGNCCSLGYGCSLGNGCSLGDDCSLGNDCSLGYDCSLGDGCMLDYGCRLGNRGSLNNQATARRSDGYTFFTYKVDEVLHISAGCRDFVGFEAARKHWEHRAGTRLGDETSAILTLLEQTNK